MNPCALTLRQAGFIGLELVCLLALVSILIVGMGFPFKSLRTKVVFSAESNNPVALSFIPITDPAHDVKIGRSRFGFVSDSIGQSRLVFQISTERGEIHWGGLSWGQCDVGKAFPDAPLVRSRSGQVIGHDDFRVVFEKGRRGVPGVEERESTAYPFAVDSTGRPHPPDSQLGAMSVDECCLSGIGILLSRLSRLVGFSQGTSHIFSLPLHGYPLPAQHSPLKERQNGNTESGNSGADGTPLQPPFGRRFAFLLYSILQLFPCCYFGSKLIDGGRQTVGKLLVAGSFEVFGAGLTLWCLIGFPWSWGWWL